MDGRRTDILRKARSKTLDLSSIRNVACARWNERTRMVTDLSTFHAMVELSASLDGERDEAPDTHRRRRRRRRRLTLSRLWRRKGDEGEECDADDESMHPDAGPEIRGYFILNDGTYVFLADARTTLSYMKRPDPSIERDTTWYGYDASDLCHAYSSVYMAHRGVSRMHDALDVRDLMGLVDISDEPSLTEAFVRSIRARRGRGGGGGSTERGAGRRTRRDDEIGVEGSGFGIGPSDGHPQPKSSGRRRRSRKKKKKKEKKTKKEHRDEIEK